MNIRVELPFGHFDARQSSRVQWEVLDHHRLTLAPCSASVFAKCQPRPDDAPVTRQSCLVAGGKKRRRSKRPI